MSHLVSIALAAVFVSAASALAQNSGPARFSDRASWVQLDLPAAWQGPRYALTARSGPDAAARQPGAAYWLSFDFLPEATEQPRQPLLRISVFARATWQKLGADAPQGDLVVQTDTRVYLGTLARDNPYVADSADAKRFEAMRFSPQALFDAFSIASDSEGAKIRTATVARTAPRNRALAAGRLLCSGRDPAWTLAIAKGSSARLTMAAADADKAGGKDASRKENESRKAGKSASQAMKGRMEFANDQAVWRGRAGKAGDWVALIREDRCEVAPRESGSHAVLLSRPDGRVWQGCCRVSD